MRWQSFGPKIPFDFSPEVSDDQTTERWAKIVRNRVEGYLAMADPYISEFKAANEPSNSDPAKDFIEIVVDEGTDVSNLVVVVYKGGALNLRQEYSLVGETPTQTLAGKDVYLIDNTSDGFFLLALDGVALAEKDDSVDPPVYTVFQAITDGNTFVANGGPLDGVTFSDVTLGDVQDVPSTQATETLDGGITYSIIDSGYTPGVILCFNSGTLIRTVVGETFVENLEVDDQVLTFDDGHQPLRWIGSVWLDIDNLDINPELKPICIRAGALGDGFPTQDLTVSPQHRILVRSEIAERMFGNTEVLVPAKKLLTLDGIEIQHENPFGVRYFHLLFDKHQIVYSNGSPTETLFTGPMALKALSSESRSEIQAIFPEICNPEHLQNPVRPIMQNGNLAQKLVQRHQKNARPMFASE